MICRFSVLSTVFVLPTRVLALSTMVLIMSIQPLGGGVGIEFITAELPWAAVGKGYEPAPLEVRVSGTCPLGGMGYTVVSGTLPQGLQLSRLGYFSGTASRAGLYEFTIRAANGCSGTMRRFAIVVGAAPLLTIAPAHLTFVAAEHDGTPEQTLRVSATWPNLPYDITIAGGDWLTALPEQGRTPGTGQGPGATGDAVRVHVDASRMKPGHYSATLTFSAWQAAPAATVVVELAVLAK